MSDVPFSLQVPKSDGMTWKIERWLSEVFPGEDRIYVEYRALTRRELAIVAAGVLDLALAELLTIRVIDDAPEYEAFFGLNEDGRAPCATFGARIQLALLLGIITRSDADILRTIKNIRNKFAHRVNVDFTSDIVKPLVLRLHGQFREKSKRLIDGGYVGGSLDGLDEMRAHFDVTPEAGAGLLLSIFTIYQAYFHRLHDLVERVAPVRTTTENGT